MGKEMTETTKICKWIYVEKCDRPHFITQCNKTIELKDEPEKEFFYCPFCGGNIK